MDDWEEVSCVSAKETSLCERRGRTSQFTKGPLFDVVQRLKEAELCPKKGGGHAFERVIGASQAKSAIS